MIPLSLNFRVRRSPAHGILSISGLLAMHVSAGVPLQPNGVVSGTLPQPPKPTSFVVIGNYGDANAAGPPYAKTLVTALEPDFIISVGDNNIPGPPSLANASWNTHPGSLYGEFMLPRSDARYPSQSSTTQRFFPAVGDTEVFVTGAASGDSSGFIDFFVTNPGGQPRLPKGTGTLSASLGNYDFQKGPFRFFVIDSTRVLMDPAAATAQRTWLGTQVPLSASPWNFMVSHHAPYVSVTGGSQPKLQWPAEWAGLDALFSGHRYVYERLQLAPGLLGFVSGLGGKQTEPQGAPLPQSMRRGNATYGVVRVVGDEHFVRYEFRYWGNAANSFSKHGYLIDSVTQGTPRTPDAAFHDYTFVAQQGESFSLYTETPDSGATTNELNPTLELIAPDGNTVAYDSDSIDGRNSRIAWTAQSSGTYTARLRTESGTGGAYRLRHFSPTHTATSTTKTWTGELEPNSPTAVNFAVIGDYGHHQWRTNVRKVANMIRSWQPEFIVTVGDNMYGYPGFGSLDWTTHCGQFYGDFMLGRWDYAFMEQTSNTQRFFPAIGNHDNGDGYAYGGGNDGATNFFHTDPGGVGRLPVGSGSLSTNVWYYDFQWGPIHFFMVDSDDAILDPEIRAQQRAWLNAAVNRSKAPWKLVVMHEAPYSSDASFGSFMDLRWPEIWPKVHGVLSGHAHVYERLEIAPGVPAFINGVGGTTLNTFRPTPISQSRFRFNQTFGAMRISADPTWLSFEFRSIADGGDGIYGGNLVDSYQTGYPSQPLKPHAEHEIQGYPGQSISISTQTPNDLGLTENLLDPALELYDSSGTLLAANSDAAADGKNAVISTSLPRSDTYRIRVSAEGSAGGIYKLSVTASAPPAAMADPLGDHDRDGRSNLMEHAFGTDPLVPDTDPLASQIEWQNSLLVFRFNLPASDAPGVRYAIQKSESLDGHWVTVATKEHGGPWSNPAVVETSNSGWRVISIPIDGTPIRGFYRVLVSVPSP